jgi:hypothetical protein
MVGIAPRNLVQNSTEDQNEEISAAHRARRFGRLANYNKAFNRDWPRLAIEYYGGQHINATLCPKI